MLANYKKTHTKHLNILAHNANISGIIEILREFLFLASQTLMSAALACGNK